MSESEETRRLERLERLVRGFQEHVALNRALGIELLGVAEREATMRLPYREDLVGDPDTGVLHGGAITALLDAASGSAAFLALSHPTAISTLDLRIDYLKPALPLHDVLARAVCTKRTRSVLFVRCTAWQIDPADPIALGTATFMADTPMGIKR